MTRDFSSPRGILASLETMTEADKAEYLRLTRKHIDVWTPADVTRFADDWETVCWELTGDMDAYKRHGDFAETIADIYVIADESCNERLFGDDGLVARCAVTRWVAHSHHDMTAAEAVLAGLAVRS